MLSKKGRSDYSKELDPLITPIFLADIAFVANSRSAS